MGSIHKKSQDGSDFLHQYLDLQQPTKFHVNKISGNIFFLARATQIIFGTGITLIDGGALPKALRSTGTPRSKF